MVPKHSFHTEINSCLIATVPEKFYDKVEEGSINLKKSKSFSFCKEGVLVNGEAQPLKTDLVILATGFQGDKKLKDIFVSPTFKDYIAGSLDATVPLYRLNFFFFLVKIFFERRKLRKIAFFIKKGERRIITLDFLFFFFFNEPKIRFNN